MTALVQKLETFMERADQLSGGAVSILRQSLIRFNEMRGSEAAASLAYYALFSLFPLTLFLAVLFSYLVTSDIAHGQAVAIMLEIFPFAGDLLTRNMQEVFQQRGSISILGLVALLYAASGFFNILASRMNLAWPKVKLRSLVHNRLIALGMVGALVILLLLSLVSTMLINLLPFLIQIIGGNPAILKSNGWLTIIRWAPALFTYLMFVALYRWVPNKTVQWKAVLIGALFVTIAWELAKLTFSLYLGSSFANYQFVYGSLGALMALMVWIYLSNLIALFGAALVATLDVRAEQKHATGRTYSTTQAETELPKGIHG